VAAVPSSLLGSRVSRAEGVAREIEGHIVGDGLAPGERLGTKEDLRRRFGVAVATVNEAVRLLEMRGLTEVRPGPGGGVFVATSGTRVAVKRSGLESWGPARFADCQAVRNGLEPLVCREAAEHRATEDLRALRRILAAMQRHVADPAAYMELNWALHRRIAKLCRNAPLHSIYLTLLDFLEDGLAVAELDASAADADLEVHRRLVDAIAAGPGPRLEAAIARHADAPMRLRADRDGGRAPRTLR